MSRTVDKDVFLFMSGVRKTNPSYYSIVNRWHRPRHCIRCGAFYKEIDNLGQWKCRNHPGDQVENSDTFNKHDPFTFSCCGLSHWDEYAKTPSKKHIFEYRNPLGCTPCDHTIIPGAPQYTEKDDIVLPIVTFRPIMRRLNAVSVIRETTRIRVRRYDFRQASERLEFGNRISTLEELYRRRSVVYKEQLIDYLPGELPKLLLLEGL